MVPSKRIALLGFGRIEHSAFEAFFRVAGRRCPAYAQEADFRAADFVIVDAADEAARQAVREAGAVGRSVVLGSPSLPGALLQMARPLNLMQVVRALDVVLASERGAGDDTVREGRVVPEEVPTLGLLDIIGEVNTASDARSGARAEEALAEPTALAGGGGASIAPEAEGGAVAPAPPASPAALAPPASLAMPAAPAAPTAPATPAAPEVTDAAAVSKQPLPFRERRGRPRGAPMEHILVVDDSDIALRFMAVHLQRFGFQIHLARSGEEALKRIEERRFEFVFLDVLMNGMDGFQTCKAIKRAECRPGQAPPTVVMLTCLNGAADRLRGTMAGADAYLTKPLREVELLKVVGEREVSRHAYAETAGSSTTR